jgi:hypothetical protein
MRKQRLDHATPTPMDAVPESEDQWQRLPEQWQDRPPEQWQDRLPEQWQDRPPSSGQSAPRPNDSLDADANQANYMKQYQEAYGRYYQEWQQQYEIWYRAQWQQWQETPQEPAVDVEAPTPDAGLPPQAQALQQEVLQEMQGMCAWNASLDDRKVKFKKWILQYHPDKAGKGELDAEVATAMFQFINAQKVWFLA